jgi:hypothetical protein
MPYKVSGHMEFWRFLAGLIDRQVLEPFSARLWLGLPTALSGPIVADRDTGLWSIRGIVNGGDNPNHWEKKKHMFWCHRAHYKSHMD